MTLSDLRQDRNLTQKQLAKKLGVSTSAVGNWEVGIRVPRWPMLKRIASFFDVSLDDIEFGLLDEQAATKEPGDVDDKGRVDPKGTRTQRRVARH